MTSAAVAPPLPRPHRPQSSAANTAPDLPETGVAQTPDAAGLGRIAADGVTLAIWRRPALPDIDTHWLPPAAVDRAALAAGAPNERIADPARAQVLAPGWVGLFKGERWPGNADRGQVHRSPPAAEDAPPRLLFCLDT